ncbi:MAG TPA: SCO family protein, partial [Candidatus Limnocylindrales bacterium]
DTVPDPRPAPVDRRALLAGGIVLLGFAFVAASLFGLVLLARNDTATAGSGGPRPAPPLELTDQDGRPFALTSLLGRPALVFFGYTSCPDVCPQTVGIISQAMSASPPGARAVFVSIDPERDDVAAMKAYLQYLPATFTGLTGTPDEVRRNADAWSVRYAKEVDDAALGGYGMAHTADIFLVDAAGNVQTQFRYGTTAETIAAALTPLLVARPVPTDPEPSPVATPASTHPAAMVPMGDLRATVVSTSVWAGGGSPVILSLADAMGMPLDGSTPVTARVVGADGAVVGPDAPAVPIRPAGENQVSYVANVDIPSPGSWRLDLVAADGTSGSVAVTALDQGASARLGGPAPDVDTPTLADVGGNLLEISTQPQSDARLYQSSTADARAAGRPYVIVIDSARFKVSPACGRALSMIRYLIDRWPDVTFIHLEPFPYQIVTGEPVLDGDIASPPVNALTRAFGLGDATWPSTAMPWIFVVDGNGVVRAKATGVIGSADVDLALSQVTGEGVIGN